MPSRALSNLSFSTSIFVALVAMLYAVVGTVSGALNWPFFIKTPEA